MDLHNKDGTIQQEGYYENGKLSGKWTCYKVDGSIYKLLTEEEVMNAVPWDDEYICARSLR